LTGSGAGVEFLPVTGVRGGFNVGDPASLPPRLQGLDQEARRIQEKLKKAKSDFNAHPAAFTPADEL
jgi:hypothetical protein